MINLWILQTMHALKPSYKIEIIWVIFGHLVTEYAEYWCYTKCEIADCWCFKVALM